MTKLTLVLPDEAATALELRALAANKPVEVMGTRLVLAALTLLPEGGGRVVVLTGEVLQTLENILGGGSLLNAADVQKKVERLAGVSFEHVRLPFTPNQLELLAEKAARNGLDVRTLIERTAPRIYEQFFDLIARSS